jgi:hypothetical protein
VNIASTVCVSIANASRLELSSRLLGNVGGQAMRANSLILYLRHPRAMPAWIVAINAPCRVRSTQADSI